MVIMIIEISCMNITPGPAAQRPAARGAFGMAHRSRTIYFSLKRRS